MKLNKLIFLILLFGIFTPVPLLAESEHQVPYPNNYRDWTRVKSMVIQEGHVHFNAFGGFHHVYANEKAASALKKGKPFKTGSVLVFELFRTIEKHHAITEGERQVIGVMIKDSKHFPETGGWGFEDFKLADPNQRLVKDMKTQCFSCHKSQKENDFVYTTYHD